MKHESSEQPWYEKAAGKKPRTEKPAKKTRSEKTRSDEQRDKHDDQREASANRHNVRAGSAKTKPAAQTQARSSAAFRRPLFDAAALPAESVRILEHFDEVISSVRALSGKQQVQLSQDIKRLSHELTDERTSRRLGYMNDAGAVSAYISYFMWWNLVRLTRLFAALPASAFALLDGDAVLDVGSGPLTVPIALWLSRPELRAKRLTVYCMDTSQNALSSGEELFLAVAARTVAAADDAEPAQPWKIVRVRGAVGENVSIKEKAALVTCANVFNEIIQSSDMPPDYLAKKYARELCQYTHGADAGKASSILLVEPGDPKSARFVSLMRDALMRKDYMPVSPCPHSGQCPMAGRHMDKNGKLSGKWCNFAFATEDAPASLLKLSERAGLPKDRASLSFVLSSNGNEAKSREQLKAAAWTSDRLTVRITSDVIHLPALRAAGYYACSEMGLLLALDRKHAQPASGDLVSVRTPRADAPVDKKSGAIITEL